MKVMCKVMAVVVLCASVGQLFAMAGGPAKKPIKIKMVKTDFASRGKPWTYKVLDHSQGNWSASKKIKNDVSISVLPGLSFISICPNPSNESSCVESAVPDDSEKKGMVIAIDKNGNVSARKEDEIKQLIEASKSEQSKLEQKVNLTNSVEISVQIPTSKVKAPFTLKSTPQATGEKYNDKRDVTSGDVVGDIYVVPLLVEKVNAGQQNKASFIRINDKPGKRIIIRNRDEKKDAIDNASKIKMGTSENVFFVID